VTRAIVVLLLLAGSALRLAAQADVSARLDGRVPPEVARAVAEVATSAAGRGLPVEPLVQKAIEGGAKGVPADRVVAAVRALAAQLDAAAGALRSGGIASPGAEVVEGGAYALSAGLNGNQVTDLARASHGPYDAALMLRVAATLAALGVPPRATLELVQDMIRAERAPADILSLPTQVQAGVARGATPAQAATAISRGAPNAPPGRPPGWVPPGQAKPKRPKP
jgi:hypothetical protein